MEELQELIAEKDNIISHQCGKIESLQAELAQVKEERDQLLSKLSVVNSTEDETTKEDG